MLVHKDQYEQAVAIAKATAQGIKVENPITAEPGSLGPISNGRQYQKIQDLIQKGVSEGAVIETGGLGHPEGLDKGYFARPTIFSNVNNDMTIAREEIFGPVMVMIPYENLDHAIEIANDTIYGLAAYIQGSLEEAKSVATKIRAGQVVINGAELDFSAPFGGFKQSGNGREWGAHGFEDFLEIKAVIEPVEQ
ncbi:aldehyde dehydrogenase family protein [Aliiglaciecola sp. 3_MG-2023]|uniref:aldehyde dehydrogenase family protein n=1 Tax=Aliiglaciecola sp. 3_MG-2023 TaxID=3062644 RepID=UPI0026E1AE7F|nr:aldehyde dehydrogenase family protein [Aliiglaciecola sp. 3_MG-2023]MDO6694668.1 aldehyde dehydrogenase family protein [Aliiglaciecola sp. 3_MG-2023]